MNKVSVKKDVAQFIKDFYGIELTLVQKMIVNSWTPNSYILFPRQSGRKFYLDMARAVLEKLYTISSIEKEYGIQYIDKKSESN